METAAPAVPSLPARPGLGERWFDLRNRLLASPLFQRRAAGWWPTRLVARRRAAQVFDLVAGFVYSQVLLACVRLHVFELLAHGARSTAWLAPRMDLKEDAADRLLCAAVAVRLLERRPDGRWGLGVLGAPLAGNAAIAAMVEHHSMLYADLADPVALLRGDAGGSLQRYWPYADAADPAALEPSDVTAYSRLMAVSQPLVAADILESYPFRAHRRVLDVGGGEGAFLQALGARQPALERHLFDLPAVAARARAVLGAHVHVHAGDFFKDPLPGGADLVTLVRVLHDHDDAAVLALLGNVRKALPAGGTVLVAEPMAATPGAEAVGDAYFGMYLLAMGQGRPRTQQVLTSMLQGAGFKAVRAVPTRLPLQVSLLAAKPA